jgi:hypothetical protein
VRLADPVHPDWRPDIEGSLVINLTVRRACHEAIGGFPDDHLCRRTDKDTFLVESDIFYKFEDLAYNRLVGGLFAGAKIAAETVEYCRHPGNAYDRQYEKFRRPFGVYPEVLTEDERLRLQLGHVLIRHRLHALRRQRLAPPAPPGGLPTPGAEAAAVLPGQSPPS